MTGVHSYFLKFQLENSIDDLSEWFAGTDSQLTNSSPCGTDPEELRQKLHKQKVSSSIFCLFVFNYFYFAFGD